MSPEQSSGEGADDYFKKLAEFAQQQQDKVSEMIEQNAKVMNEFKPFDMAKDVSGQVDKMLQSVNAELDKAMNKVNEQMKQINQQTGG